jgi:DNA-binding transcriptional MerR regulator
MGGDGDRSDGDRASKKSLPPSDGPSGQFTVPGSSGSEGLSGEACEARKREWMSTGDLARHCKTTVRTVRFYEESGLLDSLTRSCGAHRQFRGDAPDRLQLIMDLREAGLSLQQVRELFELKASATNAPEAATRMRAVLEERVGMVHEKIAVLRRLRDELGCMLNSLSECERCERADFPRACGGCDVMKTEELPRAMRLLWKCTG